MCLPRNQEAGGGQSRSTITTWFAGTVTSLVAQGGDSGGPVFLGAYVVGDASYVNSLTCNASGAYQRVDTAYSRAFLEQFI